MNYFGLWISAEYGTGHSKAAPKCSTYGSPVLSHQDEFHIDVLEVWGVGEPVIPEAEVRGRGWMQTTEIRGRGWMRQGDVGTGACQRKMMPRAKSCVFAM